MLLVPKRSVLVSALVFRGNSSAPLWHMFHYTWCVTTSVKSPIKCCGEINHSVTSYTPVRGLPSAEQSLPSPRHAAVPDGMGTLLCSLPEEQARGFRPPLQAEGRSVEKPVGFVAPAVDGNVLPLWWVVSAQLWCRRGTSLSLAAYLCRELDSFTGATRCNRALKLLLWLASQCFVDTLIFSCWVCLDLLGPDSSIMSEE